MKTGLRVVVTKMGKSGKVLKSKKFTIERSYDAYIYLAQMEEKFAGSALVQMKSTYS